MAQLPKALESFECPEGPGIYIVIGSGYWGRCFGLKGAWSNATRSGLKASDGYSVYYQSEADMAAKIQQDGPPRHKDGKPNSFLPGVNCYGAVLSYGIEGCQEIARHEKKASTVIDLRSQPART